MMNHHPSDTQLQSDISNIEKQLARPLRKLGKVRLPKVKLASLNRSLTVTSACVEKHLTARDEALLALEAREAGRERSEQETAKHHALLKTICQKHGLKADLGWVWDGSLTIASQGTDFRVTLDHLTEAELERFLSYWTAPRQVKDRRVKQSG